MEQLNDHPMIRQIERTGYPRWYDDEPEQEDDDDE